MAMLPKQAEHCSLTTLQWKPIKIGVRVVRHGRCVTCQFANVAIPIALFVQILCQIDGLRPAHLLP